jgi:EAL domain-containing protein (putative c-di-GMP-specific phosphodiesterase class I)
MPGMTGVDLLGIVRSYDLDVPVILMTGTPTLETAIEAIRLGALQYLPKPISNDVLVKAVERASQLHRMAQMKRDALKLLGEADTQAGDRAGLKASFERALETMWMAFQPIVETIRPRVFGYEALMRTREASLPHPGAVLSAAERLGLINELGRRVRALCAEAFERAPSEATLFVNLHTRDLLDPDLYEKNAPLTKMADRVVLEITERATIDDVKDIQARVLRLRRLGFRIAIDDLGAGYAGLSSFAALEPEIVKLDMSLVRDVHKSAIRQRLVESMTSLCKEMSMQVVAEGIELREELESVRRSGCDLLQGYLFAKPGPPFPHADMGS